MRTRTKQAPEVEEAKSSTVNEMSNEFLISCIVEAIADIRRVIARTPISNEELYELMLDLQHISTGLKQRPIEWRGGIYVE